MPSVMSMIECLYRRMNPLSFLTFSSKRGLHSQGELFSMSDNSDNFPLTKKSKKQKNMELN